MPDLTLTRKELATLIRDGLLPAQCPGCAAQLNVRLGGDFAALASGRSAAGASSTDAPVEKKDDVTRCTSCKKPISEYAFAVRKGLCTDCWGIMGGAAASKSAERETGPLAEPKP